MLCDTASLAVRAIQRNPMRSTLTVLGIVIGVAAVIAMVTLGSGTTARVTASIQSLGSNLLIITPGAQSGHGAGGVAVSAPPFTLRDVIAIEENVSGIAAIAPSANARAQVVFGNTNWPTAMNGTDNGYLRVRDWAITEGREFTEAELRAGRAVCLLGITVRDELFGTQDPLGAAIRVRNVPCEVIGVLASQGQGMGGADQDDAILMPIRTVQRRLNGNQDVNAIQVAVQSGRLIARVRDDIVALLRERRHLRPGDDDNFRVLNVAEIANTIVATTRVLTAFLSALAAVSLLVGGIGIMNIMLVSVTERTREIGIRLAIGALERDVLAQFLAEAVALSLFGGLIGVIVGLGGSYLVVPRLDIPFVFDPWVIFLAFGFSGTVGVLFGFVPARKAARLDPIEALRHE